MLDQTARRNLAVVPIAEPAQEEEQIGLREVLAFFRRRRLPIAIGTAIGLGLGVVYLFATPPAYQATASLLIDTRKLAIFGTGDVFEDAAINNAAVETQVQVLMSGRIAGSVVDKLGLTQNPSFMNPPQGLIAGIRSAIGGLFTFASTSGPPSPEKTKQIAMAILGSHLDVERNGLSYVIDVSYSSGDASEAARIANAVTEAYKDEQAAASFDAAKAASSWLDTRIEDLRRQAEAPGLTPQAKSAVRATYDSLIARATQMQQQETIPYSDARVITAALPPTQKSSPKTALILAAALFAGFLGGFGTALGRELLDRTIRSPKRLEALTGLPCLGVLPTFSLRGGALRRAEKKSRKRLDAAAHRFAPGATFSMVVSAPFSRYAETLRGVKVAVDRGFQNGPLRVLGVVSSLSGEGRTTVAVNLARLGAQAGGKVLLVDGDLRNPVLSTSLVAPGAPGLIEANSGSSDIAHLIWADQETPLAFLPAGASLDRSIANEFLKSGGMDATMDALRARYDLIVVDLPPVATVVDVKAASHLFDGFVYIVEWGATSEDVVIEALNSSGVGPKVIGTILNKVDLSGLGRYQPSSAMVRVRNKYMKSYRYIE